MRPGHFLISCEGSVLDALIDLFWAKHADLRQAVEQNDVATVAALDRDLDPLMLVIFTNKVDDPKGIEAQFRFAFDLLNEQAEDRGCVRRNAHLLKTLVERHLVPGATARNSPTLAEKLDGSLVAAGRAGGFLDEALLDRISDRILVVAPGYRIFYSNETNARRLNTSRDALVGRHIAEIVGLYRFRNDLKLSLDRCFGGERVSLTSADQAGGETVVYRCGMSPCLFGSLDPTGALLVIQEAADRRQRPAA